MARIVDDSNKFETWKNNTRGKVILKRFGRNGELVDEVVSAGKSVYLTPEERKFNMETAATEDLDVFQNGLLTPVKLIETAEDIAQLADNPNHLTESDMQGLFKLKTAKAFAEKIESISNPIILQRLQEMARADETAATVRQADIIANRLKNVAPSLVNEVTVVETKEMGLEGNAPGKRGPRVGVPAARQA